MKNLFAIFLFSILITFCLSQQSFSQKNTGEEDKILVAAESVFKAMKERKYPMIWTHITALSKNTIIDDVLKEGAKRGSQFSRETINNDFNRGDSLAKNYWNNYLVYFNPDTVLEQSKWEMGKIEKETAIIVIKYHKSDRPAELKMFKEGGTWKVGLEETFRTSRR